MDIAEHQLPANQGSSPTASGSQRLCGSDGCLLFGWLWERLSSTLGTPATAALIRRAISITADSYPTLRGIVVSREHLTYVYRLPEELRADDLENPVPTFRALLREVLRLMGELTGGVMVRGLIKSEELAPWLPDTQEVDKWLATEE